MEAVTDVPPSPRPEPSRRLAEAARGLWTIGALGWGLPLAIGVPLVLGGIDEVPGALRALAAVGAVLYAAVSVLVVPQLRLSVDM